MFIVFGWFIFVWCDLENPANYLSAMFTSPLISQAAIYDLSRGLLFLAILAVASTKLPYKIYLRLYEKRFFKVMMAILLPIIVLLCTAYLVDSSYNPFLYFRF